jgi:glycerate kinase
MKIVIAPDSFKGSASSFEIATWIENGIHSVIPDCETVKVAIGDGGEGSLDAVLTAGFTAHDFQVTGPAGNPVTARIALNDETAFIEMAQASGLSLLPNGVKAPLTATTFGTGQLILRALDLGATRIILAVGGSATTDAGAGALVALGAQLLDAEGDHIAVGGAALIDCASINLDQLDPRLHDVSFVLASDVENPLTGINGAARVFSPQKGADTAQVETLEAALTHFSSLVGGGFEGRAGAGAAGGFGFMAYAFLGASAQSGIDLILDLVNFDGKIATANYIITGEGRFDSQSVQGKAPWGIMQRAQKLSIPAFLICGSADTQQGSRFQEILTLSSIEPDIDKCISHPAPLVTQLGAKIAGLLK